MRLSELVGTSAAVAATSGRLEKIAKLATLLTRLAEDEVPIAIGFLTGKPRQGKLGVGWATVVAAREREPAAGATVELRDVDALFTQLTNLRGKNSASERARLVGDLFSRAPRDEQDFLGALLVGE